jgi:arylsulfatase A-like enzyme
MLVRRGDKTVDRLLGWLGNVGAQPFFAWLHLYDAHSPYRAPEPYRSRYAGQPYNGAIAFDDGQVGRVIRRLQEMGLYDRTLVVGASDHGESLGEHGEAEHGFFIYNATLRVPLIIKLPGKTMKAHVVSKPVAMLDVAPTIAQVSNVRSDSFQGSSLLRWIDQPGVASQEEGICGITLPQELIRLA